MRKTREEAARTRQMVIDAAKAEFCAKGYASTRLEDIASAVNMTRGAIYWHFRNKLVLFEQLVDHAMESLERNTEKVFTADLPTMEKFRLVLANAQGMKEELALLRAFTRSAARNNELGRAFGRLQKRIRRLQEFAVQALEEAKMRGEVHPDAASIDIVQAILIFMIGLNAPGDLNELVLSGMKPGNRTKDLIEVLFVGLNSYAAKK